MWICCIGYKAVFDLNLAPVRPTSTVFEYSSNGAPVTIAPLTLIGNATAMRSERRFSLKWGFFMVGFWREVGLRGGLDIGACSSDNVETFILLCWADTTFLVGLFSSLMDWSVP
jgi:hypothetical protein